jgi:nucleosome binding factor SPN SPT16 subunit
MQCIWRGNLLNTLDNVMLSIIIDRVHFWAMNHLKPWLSSCIDRWDRIVEEGLKRLNSRPKAPSSGYESTNFPLRRTATLDDFIEDDEQESDDEASYKADTEEDSDDSESEEDSDDSESEADFDDSESEGSSDEDSEQEQQVGDLRYAVRRTRSASNTPKKNNYQFPFRSKKF